MATVEDLNKKIAALEDAIGRGITSVYVNGERVEYASIKDMIAAIGYFRQQIAQIQRPVRRNGPIRVIPSMNY